MPKSSLCRLIWDSPDQFPHIPAYFRLFPLISAYFRIPRIPRAAPPSPIEGGGQVRLPAPPKSLPNEGKRQQRPRKIRRFKNHANIEDRWNREIREIRETCFLFVYFAYFAVKKDFLGEDLGPPIFPSPGQHLSMWLWHDANQKQKIMMMSCPCQCHPRTLWRRSRHGRVAAPPVCQPNRGKIKKCQKHQNPCNSGLKPVFQRCIPQN